MAGTIADVLNYMRVFNNELRVGAGEADEARCISALAIAQHQFENLAATQPRILQDTIDITTTANQEADTWSSSLLRLDAIWFLSDSTGRPILKLKRITEVGGYVPSLPWPLTLALADNAGGLTAGYYGNMRDFYWMPLPDGAHVMRIYGLLEQPEPATRSDSFAFPLRCKPALAAFAVKVMRIGVDDDPANMDDLSNTFFGPLLRGLRKFDRSEPQPRYYSDVHTT